MEGESVVSAGSSNSRLRGSQHSRSLFGSQGQDMPTPSSPSMFKNDFSPKELFHKRYQLFDPIMEETRFVFGLDKRGRDFSRIMLLVYVSQEEFDYHVDCYRRLRSKYVANLLDQWEDEEMQRWFIVVERSGLSLEEHLSTKEELNMEERQRILGQVCACWIHLYSLNYWIDMKTWAFMQFGKDWKLFDMSYVHKGRSDPHNALLIAKPLADAVMEGQHSILQPDEELEFQHTLGSCLLEFLLLSPIFVGKTVEDVYELISLEDLVERVRDLEESSETDAQILYLVKCILSKQGNMEDKAEDLMVASEALVDFLNRTGNGRNEAGTTSADRSRSAFRNLATCF